ncbi:MAG: TM2 domain-containing protein [Burkholderiaceae bacterium]|nr:TM2 domain-containing protein [Burkholderiaceae bacterium]
MPRRRSKTLAAWLALGLGSLGAHRFYLYGGRDRIGWLHPLPTLLGLAGAIRMHNLGQDDHAAWLLIPLLGLMLVAGMLAAIVIGLTPDERWAARHHPGQPATPSGWGAVIAVVIALLVGGTVLMGAIAFGGQKYFEYQSLDAR